MRGALLFGLILLAGCASAVYSPLDQCTGPVDRVQILRALPPAGTYQHCGSIRVDGGGFATDETMLEEAMAAARRHGANAVVIVDPGAATFTWAKAYARAGSAIAIRLRE